MTGPSDPPLYEKFFRNLQEQGVVDTVGKTYNFLMNRVGVFYQGVVRDKLPVTDHSEYNGVTVPPEIAPKRRLGERSVFSRWSPNKPVYKGYLQYLRTYVSAGDDVTIIGGGRGVSSVVAARQTGPEGRVSIFEGSPEMFDLIEGVIKMNGVRERCTLRQAVVGPAVDVYTEDDEISSVSPAELDDCDILLLDCEGAKYTILPQLDVRPQHLVVEFHPDKVSNPAEAVLSELGDYKLIETGTYYGEPVSEQRFRDLLERRKEGKPDVDGSYVKNPVGVLELDE